MLNNIKRLLCILFEFECLGIDIDASLVAFKAPYVAEDNIINHYIMLYRNSEYYKIRTLAQLLAYTKFISAYKEFNYSFSQSDFLIYKAKKAAVENLSALASEYTLEKLSSLIAISHIKFILGAASYYNLFGYENQDYGKSLICRAAQDGDIDAKLWLIYQDNSAAEKLLSEIANSPEYLSSPSLLSPWLEFYNVAANPACPVKMGFIS